MLRENPELSRPNKSAANLLVNREERRQPVPKFKLPLLMVVVYILAKWSVHPSPPLSAPSLQVTGQLGEPQQPHWHTKTAPPSSSSATASSGLGELGVPGDLTKV